MVWCRQATYHYLSQPCPISVSPHGVVRPQWVKAYKIWQHLMVWGLSCHARHLCWTNTESTRRYRILPVCVVWDSGHLVISEQNGRKRVIYIHEVILFDTPIFVLRVFEYKMILQIRYVIILERNFDLDRAEIEHKKYLLTIIDLHYLFCDRMT